MKWPGAVLRLDGQVGASEGRAKPGGAGPVLSCGNGQGTGTFRIKRRASINNIWHKALGDLRFDRYWHEARTAMLYTARLCAGLTLPKAIFVCRRRADADRSTVIFLGPPHKAVASVPAALHLALLRSASGPDVPGLARSWLQEGSGQATGGCKGP